MESKLRRLAVWEMGGPEVLHEPLPGQIDMEQAIQIGRDWITALVENSILPANLSEDNFGYIKAVLCTPDSNESLEQAFLSCWKVVYMKEDIKIDLKIHALSGQVWNAEISMQESKMLPETLSEKEMLTIAFPFMPAEMGINEETSDTYKISEKGQVYATVKRDRILVNKEEPIARLFLNLCTE